MKWWIRLIASVTSMGKEGTYIKLISRRLSRGGYWEA